MGGGEAWTKSSDDISHRSRARHLQRSPVGRIEPIPWDFSPKLCMIIRCLFVPMGRASK